MALFYNVPKCANGLTTVDGCLSRINFFDRAYALSQGAANDCAGNPQTSRLRDFTIYDTIICGEGDDPGVFAIMDQLGFTGEMAINSTSAWRATQCRPDYSFQIKTGAVSGAPGAPVTVTLAAGSHWLNGTSSLPMIGAPLELPGNDFGMAIITDKNDDVDYAHEITITPQGDGVINLSDNQRLFFGGGARVVKGGSCPVEQTLINLPGRLQRTQMVRIRKDWCIEAELNQGYDGVLQFAMGLVDGKAVECWDAVAAQFARLAMKATRDQLLLNGSYMSNPLLSSTVEGFEGFEGYIPSVLNGGGMDITFDAFDGLDFFNVLRGISRFADANRSCREYMMFVSPEFRRGITDSILGTVASRGLGVCTFEAFKKTGMNQNQIIEYLGFETYKIDNVSTHIKTLDTLASNTSYGIPGYAFNNMAIVMPACPIKTVGGKTASPVEILYPATACDSGGYYEEMIDYRKTNGCQKVGGYMIQSFAAMYHCVEYHGIIRASQCT